MTESDYKNLMRDCNELLADYECIKLALHCFYEQKPISSILCMKNPLHSREWIRYFKEINLLLDRATFYLTTCEKGKLTEKQARFISFVNNLSNYIKFQPSDRKIINDLYENIIDDNGNLCIPMDNFSFIYILDDNENQIIHPLLEKIKDLAKHIHRKYPSIENNNRKLFIDGYDLMECFGHCYNIIREIQLIICFEHWWYNR